MNIRVAISGAHRTGKSKLCKEISSLTKLPYLESSVTQIMQSSGYTTDAYLKYPKRLTAQLALADGYDQLFEQETSFITDRCHFDFLLYAYAEVNNDFPDDKELEYAFDTYVDRCVKESFKFDVLYLLQPGIKIVQAPGKGALVRPLIEKLNVLALGLAEQHNIPITVLPKTCIDFNDRVNFVLADLKAKQLI